MRRLRCAYSPGVASHETFIGPGHVPEEVLQSLEALRGHDVRWRDGRAFSLAYSAGPEVLALSEEAYRRFSGENALNMAAFPSLREMHNDVVATALRWVHGDADSAGFMTSGGTESLVLTVRAAVRRAEREGRTLTKPNMVLPTTAHAALEKGADYFGVESRRIDVGADWRADTDAMLRALDDQTVLVVASAPSYPQGVMDDVPPLAAEAAARRINCHVDACMGGVTLPYMERGGASVAPWDFRVEGVTSISVDLHKYGYAAKGSGLLLHRNKFLRADQTFVTDNWLGGTYGSSGILGTKSGGPIASSWAVMRHLGDDGYQRLTDSARSSALAIARHLEDHPVLRLRALPDSTLLCIGLRDELRHDANAPDIFAVADGLAAKGWYVDRQAPPRSIHLTVNAVHATVLGDFLSDLDAVAGSVAGPGSEGGYAVID